MDRFKTLTTALPAESGKPSSAAGGNATRTVEEMNRAAFSRGNLSVSHFERLWLRMAETFGHKWTSSYGTEPNRAWVDGLADMTVDDLKTGLGNLKTWRDEGGWPPTLLQFRELCRPHASPAHALYQPLPAPKSSWGERKHVAEASLSALREGALKPVEVPARALSEADQALLDQLDWDRIHASGAGDFERLAELPLPAPLRAGLPSEESACVCHLVQVERNDWRVSGEPCPHCRAWGQRLSQMGVTQTAAPTPERKPARRRAQRRAA